jgi:hypothetical protein
VKYQLLDRYIIEQTDDTVSWVRLFPEERRLMYGKGVYRDDVLILLFPTAIEPVDDVATVRAEFDMDQLQAWNKTTYLLHMGNARQGYPVQEAIATADGRELSRDEVLSLVDRIESVF